MKYFKNTELAKIYKVSEKSVRNWIDSSLQKKSTLQLHEEKGKFYVANTSSNTLLLEQLAAKGKKYRNSRGYKIVTPTDRLYQLYSDKQIVDIITNLDIHREIPYKYTYFDGGAEHWDEYVNKMYEGGLPSTQAVDMKQLEINEAYLDELLTPYSTVNVIDVGAGNALPVRNFLKRLLDSGKLGRYIMVDTSSNMLDIAEQNIKRWFGESIQTEKHVRDMVYDPLNDVGTTSDSTINIFMLLGGTIYNLREPDRALRTVNDSMGRNDLLVIDGKIDSERSRRYFDFSSSNSATINDATTDFRGKVMLDLLGIDRSFYKVEQSFDDSKMMRFARVRLEVAISLEFMVDKHKRIITLDKDDTILLWRAWHFDGLSTLQLLDKNDFDVLLSSRSEEYIMLVSKIKAS